MQEESTEQPLPAAAGGSAEPDQPAKRALLAQHTAAADQLADPGGASSDSGSCFTWDAACKRHRGMEQAEVDQARLRMQQDRESMHQQASTSFRPCDCEQQHCMLFNVPTEVLEHVMSFLDAPTLAVLASTCRSFLAKDRKHRLPLAHKTARELLVQRYGPELAARWRHCSWLERLQIEEAATGFDRQRCEQQGFVFTAAPLVTSCKLEGIGPKMLVSDVSTADVPILRWRLELKGNNAVEFGTIPVSLQDDPKALHKCYSCEDGSRPSGFCSSITVGSMLPVKLPVMRGSIIEILVNRNKLSFIVTNPPDGMEMTWHNTVTVSKPYKGPPEFRLEQDLDPYQPVKLAVTCWARAAFDVLHTQPFRALVPSLQPSHEPAVASLSDPADHSG